jgi:hypothetical protein
MKARIIANGVQVRKESSNSSPAIGSVALGEEIDIEAEYGEWVKLASGGWVMACYTEVTDAGTSWNSLTDKPFGESVEQVAIVPEVVSWHKEGLGVNVSLDSGSTYKVVFDGVEYECEVKGQNTGFMQMYRLGNTTIVSSNLGYGDTGEPFCVEFGETLPPYGSGASEAKIYVAEELRASEHTVSVYGEALTTVKLDPKYLPELPWLKITCDGENYSANMTYDEAVALVESKSLLGGCYIDNDGVIFPFATIEHIAGEEKVSGKFNNWGDDMFIAVTPSGATSPYMLE